METLQETEEERLVDRVAGVIQEDVLDLGVEQKQHHEFLWEQVGGVQKWQDGSHFKVLVKNIGFRQRLIIQRNCNSCQ